MFVQSTTTSLASSTTSTRARPAVIGRARAGRRAVRPRTTGGSCNSRPTTVSRDGGRLSIGDSALFPAPLPVVALHPRPRRRVLPVALGEGRLDAAEVRGGHVVLLDQRLVEQHAV